MVRFGREVLCMIMKLMRSLGVEGRREVIEASSGAWMERKD